MDEVPALLQVGLPDEGVGIDGCLIHEFRCVQQVCPVVYQVQCADRQQEKRGDITERVGKVTAGQVRAVARGIRAEEGNIEVGARVNSPHRQGLAEVFFMFLQSHIRGYVEKPAEPDRGIDHKAGQIREALAEFSLQERVQDNVEVFQVVEKIRYAVAHRFRRDFHVVFCNRYHDIPVESVIECVEGAVGILIRVRVDFTINGLRAGTAREQGRCK